MLYFPSSSFRVKCDQINPSGGVSYSKKGAIEAHLRQCRVQTDVYYQWCSLLLCCQQQHSVKACVSRGLMKLSE